MAAAQVQVRGNPEVGSGSGSGMDGMRWDGCPESKEVIAPDAAEALSRFRRRSTENLEEQLIHVTSGVLVQPYDLECTFQLDTSRSSLGSWNIIFSYQSRLPPFWEKFSCSCWRAAAKHSRSLDSPSEGLLNPYRWSRPVHHQTRSASLEADWPPWSRIKAKIPYEALRPPNIPAAILNQETDNRSQDWTEYSPTCRLLDGRCRCHNVGTTSLYSYCHR